MEASALPASVGLARARLGLGASLLRLRSDEQLVSLFRAGNEEAFRVIHDRYRARMLAYARQMLAASAADPEDAVQEIFVRAYGGLRANRRDLALRAWLYRIAHNRCIDDLRRPHAVAVEAVEELSAIAGVAAAGGAGAAHGDPHARVEQREALRRLIADVQRLPEQQRSALLMRELAGMSYADLAAALGVSVPAVKSLLVRARLGLVQAGEARDTACSAIHDDLIGAHDRGVRPSGRARRHLRDCAECRRFRSEVQGTSRHLGLLVPTLGPLAVLAKLVGFGGGGGAASSTGAAAGGGAAAAGAASGAAAGVGGSTVALSAGAAASAGHVATILAATAIAAGGAIGIQHEVSHPSAAHRHRAASVAALPATAPAPGATTTTRIPSSATGPPTSSGAAASATHTTATTEATRLVGSGGSVSGPVTSGGSAGSTTTATTVTTTSTPTTTTTSTQPTTTTTTGSSTTAPTTTTAPSTTGTATTPTTTTPTAPTTGNVPATGVVPAGSAPTSAGLQGSTHRIRLKIARRRPRAIMTGGTGAG